MWKRAGLCAIQSGRWTICRAPAPEWPGPITYTLTETTAGNTVIIDTERQVPPNESDMRAAIGRLKAKCHE